MKLVLASRNAKKINELKGILRECFPDVEILSLDDVGVTGEIEETGSTFEENALLKARAASMGRYIGVGDDSGLTVDALGGEPGIWSARYAERHHYAGGHDDEANNRLLLKELENVPEPRTARYAAAVALCRPGREPMVAFGTCEGEILREYRGEGGFGYDPLFYSDDLHMTLAEASPEAKNGISHRARAVRKLLQMLEAEDA